MRLRELQENEVVGLFKEHPLTDLPHAILEMLLDYYNLNSYGMATQKMKELTNSITAQLKQNGYTISHNGDVIQVTKGRDRYVAHEEEIMEMLLNTLFKDGIDEDGTTDDDLADRIRDREDEKNWEPNPNFKPIWKPGNNPKRFKYKEPFNPRFSRSNMDMDKFDEGMGGSSGGGTAGSAGAGGSSLGLPYPSTYEEENDKFKYRSPVQRQMSLTTEEQGEMFTDHQKMKQMMNEKGWPQDLQTEVLRKYASHVHEGQMFIRNVSYVTTKNLSNYGLLQNTDNMFILSQLPQSAINRINKEWNLKIQPSKFIKMSDLEYQKWINTSGYVSQPTVVIDADVIMAEGKWIASVIRGHRSKLCHVLTPGGPKVKSNDPNPVLSPGNQKELAFIESQNSSSLTLNQMIAYLEKAMEEKHHPDWLGWVSQNKVFKYKTIPIDSIAPADGWEPTPGKIEDMAKSDLNNAPLIVVHKDGTMIDGNHRHQALKKQGAQTVKAYIGESHPVLSEEDKLWARDELPQLNIKDFEDSNYILKQFNVDISKLKPVQNERIKGLVNKTIKMLKKGKHKPMVIDKMGYIVNGHHRYDAYNKLIKSGFFKTSAVPVIKVNATIEELIDKYM